MIESALAPAESALPADMRAWLARHTRPGMPKYIALRDAIVASVTTGNWPPGTRLPGEQELAGRVALSLGTIQRALRMVVEEGLIERRPGQGSFVVERDPSEMSSPLHCRFVDDSAGAYLPVFSKAVSRTKADALGPWSEHLGPSGSFLRIDRVLDINHEFAVFSRFYVDSRRMPAFAELPLRKLSGQNFKEIIWRESHQPVSRLTQHLSNVKFDAEVAGATDRRQGTQGLLLEVRAFLSTGSPIYYQELYIPPNRRRLRLAGD